MVASAAAAYVLFRSDGRVSDENRPSAGNGQQEATPPENDQTIRILLTGDIIAHDSLNENAESDGGYDYLQFMSTFQSVFQSSDIVFCNQSTLIGGDTFPITGYPSFNAPAALARDMAAVGCNVINTASNHSFDKTQSHIDANVQIWEQQDVFAVAGQNASAEAQNDIATFTVEGKTFAFLAYTTYSNVTPPNSYGVNMYSRERASTQIAAARAAGADYIMTSMRWGTEYADSVNSFQKAEAAFLAGEGVDIIVGHGPHVLQPVDRLSRAGGGETIVWYSLGNFLQTQLEPEALFNAIGVVDINLSSGQTTLAYEPIYMHYEWTPQERARGDLLQRKNLQLTWLDEADDLFARSPLSGETSIEQQATRIREVLNRFTPVELIDISQ